MTVTAFQRQMKEGIQLLANLPVKELIRYAIVGLTLNSLGYMVYLLVTSFGVSPLMTVTIFYPLSVLAGYFAHRRHTFRHKSQGLEGTVLVRYILVYVAGYLINASLLEILYQQMGYPHQLVQILAIFMVAAFFFVAMKLFVFRKANLAAASS
ncbi:MAG: GtrA family protein [Chromatiaceae bacterium]|nr:GtrA family protein [Chromatiaceae bacterium]